MIFLNVNIRMLCVLCDDRSSIFCHVNLPSALLVFAYQIGPLDGTAGALDCLVKASIILHRVNNAIAIVIKTILPPIKLSPAYGILN